METLETINERLKASYGTDITGFFPKFRVVWSDSQLEMRKGTRNVFSHGAFLRSENFCELVKKYPFIKERHVLEQFYPTDNPELVEGYKNYEPIYVFEDRHQNSLPLAYWPASYLANSILNGGFREIKPETEESELAEEYQEYVDILDDAVPEIPARLKRGEGVSILITDYWRK